MAKLNFQQPDVILICWFGTQEMSYLYNLQWLFTLKLQFTLFLIMPTFLILYLILQLPHFIFYSKAETSYDKMTYEIEKDVAAAS